LKLLCIGKSSPKIAKSDKANKGYLSAILYLAPWKSSGGHNVCANASVGCISSCLFYAGRGRCNNVINSRVKKTNWLFDDTKGFIDQLYKELSAFEKRCKKAKKKPAIRLNGTSDLEFQRFKKSIYNDWPDVQFYDYTKNFFRARQWLDGYYPKNYHLTFSRSETNEEFCWDLLDRGMNVAVVFWPNLPKKWRGYPVFNADETDLRFIDKFGIQGLIAKGKAKKDTTGFVIRNLK
jgi:hypothetical protein